MDYSTVYDMLVELSKEAEKGLVKCKDCEEDCSSRGVKESILFHSNQLQAALVCWSLMDSVLYQWTLPDIAPDQPIAN